MLTVLQFVILLVLSGPAAAHLKPVQTIELKERMCHAVADAPLSAEAVRRLPYSCGSLPKGFHERWLWLRADAADLRHLPAEWRLLIDQTRFATMRTVMRHADGMVTEHRFRSGRADGHWEIGGFLRFDPEYRASPVTEIYVGIERLVNFNTMRKIRVVSDAELDRSKMLWTALVSLFGGIVGASLAYTAFLYAGLRRTFLRQYVCWCAAVLAYGASWSNLLFYALPGLAGSWGVRLNLWTAGLATLFAALFMSAFLEADALPRRLRRLLVGTGWASLAAAVLASLDGLGTEYAYVTDRLLNAIVAFGVVLVLVCMAVAYRRGSRSVRFYALAWSPALAAFVLRMLRNFHLVPHADWIDMCLFGATAVEALLLSAAIADRFRKLESERNSAQAESAEFSRLAETDVLTGVYNRRGFVARAEAMNAGAAPPVGLILLDVDRFKAINDRYGHDAGDRVLAEIGRVLGRLSDATLTAGRLGGEEFGVVAAMSCPKLIALAERLRKEIDALRFDFNAEIRISASAGIACAHQPLAFVDLYRRADEALYAAKAQGRDRIVVAEETGGREAA